MDELDMEKFSEFDGHQRVMRIESGVNKNPTIEMLTKLARALEVSVDDLIK